MAIRKRAAKRSAKPSKGTLVRQWALVDREGDAVSDWCSTKKDAEAQIPYYDDLESEIGPLKVRSRTLGYVNDDPIADAEAVWWALGMAEARLEDSATGRDIDDDLLLARLDLLAKRLSGTRR